MTLRVAFIICMKPLFHLLSPIIQAIYAVLYSQQLRTPLCINVILRSYIDVTGHQLCAVIELPVITPVKHCSHIANYHSIDAVHSCHLTSLYFLAGIIYFTSTLNFTPERCLARRIVRARQPLLNISIQTPY